LRTVEVCARDGHVVLRGRVPSYYLKQVAQEVALAMPGVLQLRNELDVQP
jgi:osmotically-inducible protein OsmY